MARKRTIKTTKNKTTKKIKIDSQIQKINFDSNVPKKIGTYYMPAFVENIVRRIKMKRNILLTGPTGCGKSEFVIRLAEYFGVKVLRVNLSVGTTEQHLIGKYIVKNGATEFVYGVVPQAMMNGWWLLLDEIDYAEPEHLAVLQPILEGNNLLLTQNENEEIIPHENFRVFATANTKGRGDSSRGYVGTNFLNMAFLDRWCIFEFNYPVNQEEKIIANIISDDKLIKQIIQFTKLIRKAELDNFSFSTRRLIHIAEALAAGETLKDALEYEVFSRYEDYEQSILREIAFDVWDREYYFKNSWKLGMEHMKDDIFNKTNINDNTNDN